MGSLNLLIAHRMRVMESVRYNSAVVTHRSRHGYPTAQPAVSGTEA
jgi:hypothetical protein